MKRQAMLCLAMATLLSAAASAQDKAEKKLYCWSENGQQVCGDTLPPSAVDHARTEINPKSGMRVGEVPRALNQDERAAAAVAAKQAAEAAEEDAAQKRRDLAMVTSYATEADLRRAYGERITLVEESLKTSHLGVANLRQSLLSLLRKAAELELQAKPVNKSLTDNIQSQHADLLRQQTIMQKQQLDRASLGSDLEDALARYRAMKVPTQG
jgi:hypothetical protein